MTVVSDSGKNSQVVFSLCLYCKNQTFYQPNPWTWECNSCGKKLVDEEVEASYIIAGVEGYCKHLNYDYCRSLDKNYSPGTGYTRKRKGDWLVHGVIEIFQDIRKNGHSEISHVIELGEPRGEEHKHPDGLVVFKNKPPILFEGKNIVPYYGYHSISTKFRTQIEEKKWDGGTYYERHSNKGGKAGKLKPVPFQIVNPRRVLIITLTDFLPHQDQNKLVRRFETIELGHAYLPSPSSEPEFKDPQPECMEKVNRRLRMQLMRLIENQG